jgi:hypothetical protein
MKTQQWMTMILVLAVLLTPGQAASAQANSRSGQQYHIANNAGVSNAPTLRAQVHGLAAGETPTGLSNQEWSSMQAQMQLAQYQVTWQTQDGVWAYRAPNLALGLALAFGDDGSTATRYANGRLAWQFGLRPPEGMPPENHVSEPSEPRPLRPPLSHAVIDRQMGSAGLGGDVRRRTFGIQRV